MARRVVWSEEALGDLERIADYIERDSPFYARSFVRRLLESTRNLAEYPRMGRVVPELGDTNLRELVVHHYRVFYRVEDEVLSVVAVVHSRQSLGQMR